MDIIFGDRATGKTTKLIELCAEREAAGEVSYIVCHTHNEAYRIAQQANKSELSIGFPLTYHEFRNREYWPPGPIRHFLIDNAEMLLQQLTPVNIHTVTMLYHPDGT